MNRQFKRIVFVLIILVLLISACENLSVTQDQPSGTQVAEQPAGVQGEAGSLSQSQVGDHEQRNVAERDQAAAIAAAAGGASQVVATNDPPSFEERDAVLDGVIQGGVNQGDPVLTENIQIGQSTALAPELADGSQAEDPENIPSLEERNAMLEGINPGGPVFPEDEQTPVEEGPAPGTESILGNESQLDDMLDGVNPGGPILTESIQTDQFTALAPGLADGGQAVDPEDIPSLDERDAMLEGVNIGGPVFPESQQAPVGEGPEPGTETIIDAGSTSNTSEETAIHPLNQFIEMLRNWLQAIFSEG
jgi:hypothetical protein